MWKTSRPRNGTWWFMSSESKLNLVHLYKSDMIPQDLPRLLMFESVYNWYLSFWLFLLMILGEKKKATNESLRMANAEGQSFCQSAWQLIKMMHHQDSCPGMTGSRLLLPGWHVRRLFATLNTWNMNVNWMHAKKVWMDAEELQQGSGWMGGMVPSLFTAPH